MKKIYETYGHYAGHALCESTHERYHLNPLHHVWNVRGERNGVIDDACIDDYFRLPLQPCYEIDASQT